MMAGGNFFDGYKKILLGREVIEGKPRISF